MPVFSTYLLGGRILRSIHPYPVLHAHLSTCTFFASICVLIRLVLIFRLVVGGHRFFDVLLCSRRRMMACGHLLVSLVLSCRILARGRSRCFGFELAGWGRGRSSGCTRENCGYGLEPSSHMTRVERLELSRDGLNLLLFLGHLRRSGVHLLRFWIRDGGGGWRD